MARVSLSLESKVVSTSLEPLEKSLEPLAVSLESPGTTRMWLGPFLSVAVSLLVLLSFFLAQASEYI